MQTKCYCDSSDGLSKYVPSLVVFLTYDLSIEGGVDGMNSYIIIGMICILNFQHCSNVI